MEPLYRWIIGITVSVIVGLFASWAFLALLRRYMGIKKDEVPDGDGSIRRVPPWLTGVLERTFFSVIIGLNISGAPIAMIGWLTLKMVTNWNRPGLQRDVGEIRAAFASLLAGLVSMFFAAVGGVICRGSLG
jgi:hypothetical protein